jgi:hypothetical protein
MYEIVLRNYYGTSYFSSVDAACMRAVKQYNGIITIVGWLAACIRGMMLI